MHLTSDESISDRIVKVSVRPECFTGGIEGPACDRDGNLYCVSFQDIRNIARVTPDGRAEIFVTLPAGSAGNGLVVAP
mgnify:CR=1 FL=1